jgi:hypothetical protein
MKTIELTQGQSVVVDDELYDELAAHKWCYTNGYAARRMPNQKKGQHLYMHREICPAEPDKLVIHIDGNKLNNRKANLSVRMRKHRSQAVATRAASGLKGVTFHHGKWVAQISIDKKNKHLGRFADKIAAAREYDKMARMVYGDCAHVNFPPGHEHYVEVPVDEVRQANVG